MVRRLPHGSRARKGMENIVMSLFAAVAMSVAAASPYAAETAPAAATEAEFTPLD